MHPRTGDAHYRFVGVIIAFSWVICDPSLNAEPGIRAAVEKSAHVVITRSRQDRSRVGVKAASGAWRVRGQRKAPAVLHAALSASNRPLVVTLG